MLPLLMEVLQAVALPVMMLTIVISGCGGDSRPKKDQHSKSKSKKHRSGKGKSKSDKSSKMKKKGYSSRSSKGVIDSRSISRAIGAEPPKEMMMEPAELHWSTTGGVQKVVITNRTDERRAVKLEILEHHNLKFVVFMVTALEIFTVQSLMRLLKPFRDELKSLRGHNFPFNTQTFQVKCSDNNLYRVNPVFSFIEPGQSLGIDIVRQNGGAKVDKMVFVTTKVRVHSITSSL
ncbi:unnamed protein product [Toxocara canis]|uniref:Major sperm protein n=1 Tax=Toxocara canis TaxID=6265 RepID=A0A183V998_TOXCA|nr:unnamed protein product [Toxocara canis]